MGKVGIAAKEVCSHRLYKGWSGAHGHGLLSWYSEKSLRASRLTVSTPRGLGTGMGMKGKTHHDP